MDRIDKGCITDLTIREITKEDYQAAHSFQQEYLDREDYVSFLHRVEANPDLYLGAFRSGELIGICYGEPSKRDSLSICLQGIAVTLDTDKGLARRGIGSRLIAEFEEAVRKKRYHKISLGAADDEKVEKFYLKNGYEPFELVVKGQNQEELERAPIQDYETGKVIKQILIQKYNPLEVIFIFQKLI